MVSIAHIAGPLVRTGRIAVLPAQLMEPAVHNGIRKVCATIGGIAVKLKGNLRVPFFALHNTL